MKKNISICVMAAIIAMSVATITGCGADSGISATGKVSTETKQATSADDTSDNSSATAVDEKATESSENSNKGSKSENDKNAPTASKESSDKSSSKTDSNSTSTKTNSSSKGQNGSAKTSGNTSSGGSSENKASKSSSSSFSSKPSSSSSSSKKTWHEAVYKTVNHPAEIKKVWVVDKKAYSYEEPVYEMHDRTICNNCGADITDNVGDHMYNHLVNGEKKGYHNEWVEVQVGTKTVNVPEEGHWETKVIKEAWTEKVLVKEAGYY